MNDDCKGPDPTHTIHQFLNSVPYICIYLHTTENFMKDLWGKKKTLGKKMQVYYKVLGNGTTCRH